VNRSFAPPVGISPAPSRCKDGISCFETTFKKEHLDHGTDLLSRERTPFVKEDISLYRTSGQERPDHGKNRFATALGLFNGPDLLERLHPPAFPQGPAIYFDTYALPFKLLGQAYRKGGKHPDPFGAVIPDQVSQNLTQSLAFLPVKGDNRLA